MTMYGKLMASHVAVADTCAAARETTFDIRISCDRHNSDLKTDLYMTVRKAKMGMRGSFGKLGLSTVQKGSVDSQL